MRNSGILKNLTINRNSSEPLTTQLARGLENAVRNASPGLRLPSEREMAEGLGVSRVTVRNALKLLKKRDILASHERFGAYIPEKTTREGAGHAHPMAMSMPGVPQKASMSLLLYENIPFQKDFWEKAVDEYNSLDRACGVKIKWVPLDIVSEADFTEEFLDENNIDVFQYTVNSQIKSLAAELPSDLVDELRGEKYNNEVFAPEARDLLTRVAPTKINMALTFWNPRLAEEAGLKNVRERIRGGGLVEMIEEASAQLPDGCTAYGHIWAKTFFYGRPASDADVNLEYFKRLLGQFSGVRDFEKSYIYVQRSPYDAINSFHSGRMLFIESHLSALLFCGHTLGSDMLWEPSHVPEGHVMPAAALGLAVARRSRRHADAVDFMRFMLSERVQRVQAGRKLSPSFLKSSLRGMTDAAPQVSMAALRKNLGSCRVFDIHPGKRDCSLDYFLVFNTRDELARLCRREISVEEAARLLDEKWRSLRSRD